MVSFSPASHVNALAQRLAAIAPGLVDLEIEELVLYGDVEIACKARAYSVLSPTIRRTSPRSRCETRSSALRESLSAAGSLPRVPTPLHHREGRPAGAGRG